MHEFPLAYLPHDSRYETVAELAPNPDSEADILHGAGRINNWVTKLQEHSIERQR
jgi:hypothetical protein